MTGDRSMTTKPVVEIIGDVLSAEFCETLNMRPAAEQVIEALDAAGFAIVPKVPTEAMIEASYTREREQFGPLARGLKHSAIYETMLAAAAEDQL